MLVSVVVAVYNAGPYLEKCISSLQNQTYKDLEIICVNDGSVDESLSMLERFAQADRRIHIFSKENEGRGAAPARNMGVDHSNGVYVMVLDSDDFFEPDMVEVMVEKAESANADMVFCTARHYDHVNQCSGSVFKRPELQYAPPKEYFSWRDCPDYIFQIADFVAWNKLFKREFLKQNHLRFEGIPISDDQYPSVMGSVLAKRIAIVHKPLVNYRVNTGKSQVDSQSEHPEAAYAAVYSVVNRMREMGVYEKVKRSYCNIAILLMRQYFDRMKRIEDVRFLYDKFRNDVFPFLGAERLNLNDFYDHRVGEWYEMIMGHPLDDILFRSARAYGSSMTTASLRFKAPLESIKKGSNIAVVGKGIVGRFWYAELILSDLCGEIFWVSSQEDIPNGVRIDQILNAE